jgi:hypothetical protein
MEIEEVGERGVEKARGEAVQHPVSKKSFEKLPNCQIG